MNVQELVEEEFGYAEIAVVSLPDLYGGKLCAAMDRQHPRDLYDVRMLLQTDDIDREIFIGFLTYALGHPRPINEVMSPIWRPLEEAFNAEFDGMTKEEVTLKDLLAVPQDMVAALQSHLTAKDRAFLLSFKQGAPDWSLFDYPNAKDLPAIQWKLLNINKLAKNKKKHEEQLKKLENVLDTWVEN